MNLFIDVALKTAQTEENSKFESSLALAAVYFAVEGVGDFLVNTGYGELEFDVEKGCRWIRGSKDASQTSICQRDGVSPEFSDYLNRLIALTPKSRQ